MKKTIQTLQEYSVPLLLGVISALICANCAPSFYHQVVDAPLLGMTAGEPSTDGHSGKEHDQDTDTHRDDEHVGGAHAVSDSHHVSDAHHVSDSHGVVNTHNEARAHEADHTDHSETQPAAHGHGDGHGHSGWGHWLTLHFWVNDLFMVLFFGIAAKEITEACLPNGALNPPAKAVNPLLATLGGVFGPVGVFLLLNGIWGQSGWTNGWGIPTATDIALAWLVARLIFGSRHPAVSFLLLLAVADDAIGLGIIAFAYPNPNLPTQWINTVWILPAMGIAYGLRRKGVAHWLPYAACSGLSWWGLYSAHLHPALAMVFVVPFMPAAEEDLGLFVEEAGQHDHSTLEAFEHQLKPLVDFGLFFFAFANAGVPLSGVSGLSWIVFLSLLVGKTIGITAFSLAGVRMGFPLPQGMTSRHLVVTSVVAGLGLTVALFVSAQAFTDPATQGAAKMGALMSALIAAVAVGLGWLLLDDFGGRGETDSKTDKSLPTHPTAKLPAPQGETAPSKAALLSEMPANDEVEHSSVRDTVPMN